MSKSGWESNSGHPPMAGTWQDTMAIEVATSSKTNFVLNIIFVFVRLRLSWKLKSSAPFRCSRSVAYVRFGVQDECDASLWTGGLFILNGRSRTLVWKVRCVRLCASVSM
ncbi:Uncharacterized protein FWK35_00000213 [Aphis craccivora]|uniref:Uncharacterized protein n=1 Tax=Aphis craccivora TaxID=307492 RepID=A0A6G0ZRH3_APHCR|nr:Uncharacterized protein FWK35_00000213 [Aphis craccivora]